MTETVDAPDPLEVSRVLTSELVMLQKIADFAVEDTIAIASSLGIVLDPAIAPRQQLYEVLIPKINQLMVEHGFLEAAQSEIKTAAARFGNKTIEKDGHKGLLVGKKIPGLFDQSRRERREAERQAKRRGR